MGLSARPQHFSGLLEKKQVPWIEVLADNYQYKGSPAYDKLERLADIYPLVFHCVGFNLGSPEPLHKSYLEGMHTLVKTFQPKWISDHLCFCGNHGEYSPDLLPIAYTDKMLQRIGEKIKQIQDLLQIPFLVENVSVYLREKEERSTEEEFLHQLTQRYNCSLLLDVNNIYVNSTNFHFDAYEAFCRLPKNSIQQIHLAGYTDYGSHIIDTHGENIHPPVLELYRRIAKDIPHTPATIERDSNIPSLDSMLNEVKTVDAIYNEN